MDNNETQIAESSDALQLSQLDNASYTYSWSTSGAYAGLPPSTFFYPPIPTTADALRDAFIEKKEKEIVKTKKESEADKKAFEARIEKIRQEYADGKKKLQLHHFIEGNDDVMICLGKTPPVEFPEWTNIFTTFRYINELVIKHSYDIDHWDLLNYFCDEKGDFIQEKRKLNAFFMSRYLEERKTIQAEQIAWLTDDQKDAITRLKSRQGKYDKKQLEAKANEARRAAQGHYENYTAMSADLQIWNAAINNKDINKVVLVDEIQKAINQFPHLQYNGLSENALITFITKQNIVLTERNQAAGIDISVNLGKFKIQVKPFSSEIIVRPHTGNILYNNYFHPHVGNNYIPCLGTAHHQTSSALLLGDIASAIGNIYAVLTSFNPNNPYITLQTFKQVFENKISERRLRRFGGPSNGNSRWHQEANRAFYDRAMRAGISRFSPMESTDSLHNDGFIFRYAAHFESKVLFALVNLPEGRTIHEAVTAIRACLNQNEAWHVTVEPFGPVSDYGDESLDNETPDIARVEVDGSNLNFARPIFVPRATAGVTQNF